MNLYVVRFGVSFCCFQLCIKCKVAVDSNLQVRVVFLK